MARAYSNPLPPLPATIRIPTFKVTATPSGDIDIPASVPFYYAGISSIWVYWQVELPVLLKYMKPKGMLPAEFDGMGAVGINFFNAVALYGQGQPGNPGAAGFNETEVNILGYAANQRPNVPKLTLKEYLENGDQTKRIGNYRVWVACDNAVAVAAGRQLYFENKFQVDYTYNVPALNNPGQYEYSWTCHDHDDNTKDIYGASVSLSGLNPVPGNMSEWVDLSYVESAKRVAGSRRNYFGMHQTYYVPSANKAAIKLFYGKSAHPMREDMQQLIGNRKAFAVQVFQSPTCIAEARAYWADL